MSGTLEITILGCGSSGGVPRADGDWGICDPAEPKNRRLRCSLLVRRHGPEGVTTVLIDTSPDLRAQMLAADDFAAGRAAAEDDHLQLARHAASGRGMRSNRAKKASVVRASASARDQPRMPASFSRTWPTYAGSLRRPR